MTSGWLLFILFMAGLVAGLVDAIAGGGGLITIPILLGIGLPPQTALGTNKLQASFGSGSAMFHFARAGAISLGKCGEGIAFTAVGAGLGAFCVQRIDPGFLRAAIPFLLVAIALYTLVSPRLGYADVHPRLNPVPFYLLAGLALGFYDGFFGPGTGSFWVMALMLGLGYSMQRATGYTKVMNFTSNIVARPVRRRRPGPLHRGDGDGGGAAYRCPDRSPPGGDQGSGIHPTGLHHHGPRHLSPAHLSKLPLKTRIVYQVRGEERWLS